MISCSISDKPSRVPAAQLTTLAGHYDGNPTMIRAASSTRDTERSQALVRLVLSSIATLYVILLYLTGYLVEAQLRSILICNAAFLVASFALIA